MYQNNIESIVLQSTEATMYRIFCCFRDSEKRIRDLEDELRDALHTIECMRQSSLWEAVRDCQSKEAQLFSRMYECKICMNFPVDSVIMPCGHTLACKECVGKLNTCPVCNTKVEEITHIHIL